MAVQARQRNRQAVEAAAAIQVLLSRVEGSEESNPRLLATVQALANGVERGDQASITRAIGLVSKITAREAARTAPPSSPAEVTPRTPMPAAPSISAQAGRRQPTQPRQAAFRLPRSTADPSIPTQVLEAAGAPADESRLASLVNTLENIALAAEIPRLVRWTGRRVIPQVAKYVGKKAVIMGGGSTMTPAMGAALTLGSIGFDIVRAYKWLTTGEKIARFGKVIAPTGKAYRQAGTTGFGRFARDVSQYVGTSAGLGAGSGRVGLGVHEENPTQIALGIGEVLLESLGIPRVAASKWLTTAWRAKGRTADSDLLKAEGVPPKLAEDMAAKAEDVSGTPAAGKETLARTLKEQEQLEELTEADKALKRIKPAIDPASYAKEEASLLERWDKLNARIQRRHARARGEVQGKADIKPPKVSAETQPVRRTTGNAVDYAFDPVVTGSGFTLGTPPKKYLKNFTRAAKANGLSALEARELWQRAQTKVGSPQVKAAADNARKDIADMLGSNPWNGQPWVDATGVRHGAIDPGPTFLQQARKQEITRRGVDEAATVEEEVVGGAGDFLSGSLLEANVGGDILVLGGHRAMPSAYTGIRDAPQILGDAVGRLEKGGRTDLADLVRSSGRSGDPITGVDATDLQLVDEALTGAFGKRQRVPHSTSSTARAMAAGDTRVRRTSGARQDVIQKQVAEGLAPRDVGPFEARIAQLLEVLRTAEPTPKGWKSVRTALTSAMRDQTAGSPDVIIQDANKFADKGTLKNALRWQKKLFSTFGVDVTQEIDLARPGTQFFKTPNELIANAVQRSQAELEGRVRKIVENVVRRDVPEGLASLRGRQQVVGKEGQARAETFPPAYTGDVVEDFLAKFFAKKPWKSQLPRTRKRAVAPYEVYTHPAAAQLFRFTFKSNVLKDRMIIMRALLTDSPPEVKKVFKDTMDLTDRQAGDLDYLVGRYAAALTHPVTLRGPGIDPKAAGRYLAGTVTQQGVPHTGPKKPQPGRPLTAEGRLPMERQLRQTVRAVAGDPGAVPDVPENPAEILKLLTQYTDEQAALTQNASDFMENGTALFSTLGFLDPEYVRVVARAAQQSPAFTAGAVGGVAGGVSGGVLGQERAEDLGHTGWAKGVDVAGGVFLGALGGALTGAGITKTAPGPTTIRGIKFKTTLSERIRALHLYMLLTGNALLKAAGGAHMAGYFRAVESLLQGGIMRMEGGLQRNPQIMAAGTAEIAKGKKFGTKLFTLQSDFVRSFFPEKVGGIHKSKSVIRQLFGINPDNPSDLQRLAKYSASPNFTRMVAALGEEAMAGQLKANWLGRGFRAGDWPVHKAMVDVYGPEVYEEARRLSLTGTFSTKLGQGLYRSMGSGTSLHRAREAYAAAIQSPDKGAKAAKLPGLGTAGMLDVARQLFLPVPRVVLQQAEQTGRYLFAPAARVAQDIARPLFRGTSLAAHLKKLGTSGQGLEALAPKAISQDPVDVARARSRNLARLGMSAGIAGMAGAAGVDDRLMSGTVIPLLGHFSGPALLAQALMNERQAGQEGWDIGKTAARTYAQEATPYSSGLLAASARMDPPAITREVSRQFGPAMLRNIGRALDTEHGRQTTFGAQSERERRGDVSPFWRTLGPVGTSLFAPLAEAGLATRTLLEPREPPVSPYSGEPQFPPNAVSDPFGWGRGQPGSTITPGETIEGAWKRIRQSPVPTGNPLRAIAQLGGGVAKAVLAPETLLSSQPGGPGRDRSARLLAEQGRMTPEGDPIIGVPRAGALPSSSGYPTDETGRPMTGITREGRKLARFSAAVPTRQMYQALKQVELNDPERFQRYEDNPALFRGWIAMFKETRHSPILNAIIRTQPLVQRGLGATKSPVPAEIIPPAVGR